jgi:HxlR-like helix-turn-helix
MSDNCSKKGLLTIWLVLRSCGGIVRVWVNGLVKRSVLNTKPNTVEYELSVYGHTAKPINDVIVSWGCCTGRG